MAEHKNVTLYRWVGDCDHPEPGESDDELVFQNSPAWRAWDEKHPYSDEGDERICLLTPLPEGRCDACSDANGGEDTPCQLEAVPDAI